MLFSCLLIVHNYFLKELLYFPFENEKNMFYKFVIVFRAEDHLPIAIKISLTFIAVLAEVSMKSKLLSSAYACASYKRKYTYVIGNLAPYIHILKNFIKEVKVSESKTPSLPGNLQLFCWPSLLCSLPVQ